MKEETELKEQFERVNALFEGGGLKADAATLDLLQPLLSGQMTLEEHEAWLMQQLAEVTRHG